MRIAVWHNLPSGGGKRSLYNHVKGLLERGHTVESWCPPTADQTYLPLSKLITEHIVPFSGEPRELKVPFIRSLSAYYNVVDKIKAMDRHCQKCADEINCGEFNLLFANPCMFFRTTSIGRYVKIPKFIYLQEPYRSLYEALPKLPWLAFDPPETSWWSPKYLRRFSQNLIEVQGLRVQLREELLNAQAFDTILVNSLFSRESVLRAYGLDAKVCYLGIDTKLFQPTDVPRENFVVGLGGIYLGKGLERAVRAVGTIEINKRPDLVWIGNFSSIDYQKEIEALAALLKVNFIPKVQLADDEVVDILNRSSLMIYTSRLEPFGFAPLEANACGTPVIAIAEGGVRESIKDGINGFLIDNDDPVAIGQAILNLMERPDLSQEMGARARRYALEHWSWDIAIDRLEKYFFDVCVT